MEYRQSENRLNSNTTLLAGNSTTTGTLSGILSVDTTAVGNVTTGEDTLMTYSLPANALSANGKAVRITAWGTTAANANTKTHKLHFGSTAVATFSNTGSAQNWFFMATVVRTGAAAQEAFVWAGKGTSGNFALGDVERTTPAEDVTAAITIKVTGQSTEGATNDVVQRGMIVEILN